MNPLESYRLKRIDFNSKKGIPIVLQNTNGPCPLLAVANILLLRGDIAIHEDKAFVGTDELLGLVGEFLLDYKVEVNDVYRANYERNVHDVIQMLPKTQKGIDVNVQFKSISAFEFTSEAMLFDFCNTRLVHGWLADPQDLEMFQFLRDLSYNQLVEKQIQYQTFTQQIEKTGNIVKKLENLKIEENQNQAPESETVESTATKEEEAFKITREGLLAERFMNENATQLTYYGLSELHSGLKNEELCVFFRNNHFSTLYKHDGELCLLVTDQGYASEPLVWEKLSQIDGDSIFLRSDYTRYEAVSPIVSAALSLPADDIRDFALEDRLAQSDSDMALALQLQQEEEARNEKRRENDIKTGEDGDFSHSKNSGEKRKGHKDKNGCVVQ